MITGRRHMPHLPLSTPAASDVDIVFPSGDNSNNSSNGHNNNGNSNNSNKIIIIRSPISDNIGTGTGTSPNPGSNVTSPYGFFYPHNPFHLTANNGRGNTTPVTSPGIISTTPTIPLHHLHHSSSGIVSPGVVDSEQPYISPVSNGTSPTLSVSSAPTSPTSLSPSIVSSPSVLSSLNTSALVRTISNGSTFGPIPNWPLCVTQSSSSTSSVSSPPPASAPTSNHGGPTGNGNQTKPQPGTHDGTNTHQTVNVTSPGVNGASPTLLATTAPAQTNVPLKLQIPLIFGEHFVLTSQIPDASNLYKCLDINTNEEYWCKVELRKTYYDFLAPHLRMEGYEGISQVQKIIIGRLHTFILFEPSFGDLHSYVRNKRRLRESEAMPLFRQIVQIVADCHAHGIILRDLKLRKFIFSNKERTKLKLETLEGASLFDDDDTLTDKHGCPAYVSPEILLSDSFSGLAADCWSMGVILYTMLKGRYPFHDINPTSMFCQIRRGIYCIPDGLSIHAKCLIRSLMRMDPNERLSAEDALSHPWFQSNIGSIRNTPTSISSRNRSSALIGQQQHPYYHVHYVGNQMSNNSGSGQPPAHNHHHHYHHHHHHHHHSHHHQQQQSQQHSSPTLVTTTNSSNNLVTGQPSPPPPPPPPPTPVSSMSIAPLSLTLPRNATVPVCCLNANNAGNGDLSSSSSADQFVPDLRLD